MQKTDADLIIEADVIKNETVASANTALRNGEMLNNLIDSKTNNDKIDTANTLDTASKTVPGRDAVVAYIAANSVTSSAIDTAGTLDTLGKTIPGRDAVKTYIASAIDDLAAVTSVIDPLGTSLQVFQNAVGPAANDMPIEIVNIGYTGHGATDDIHQNTTGVVRINGRINLVRNMQWDQVNAKWLTPIQTADAYGSACFEVGGEACILHATPSGVNFSDVPHEILLAKASGTDGQANNIIIPGISHKARRVFLLGLTLLLTIQRLQTTVGIKQQEPILYCG